MVAQVHEDASGRTLLEVDAYAHLSSLALDHAEDWLESRKGDVVWYQFAVSEAGRITLFGPEASDSCNGFVTVI